MPAAGYVAAGCSVLASSCDELEQNRLCQAKKVVQMKNILSFLIARGRGVSDAMLHLLGANVATWGAARLQGYRVVKSLVNSLSTLRAYVEEFLEVVVRK